MSDLRPAEIAPVGPVQVARYAAAVQDFNPVHFDPAFATSAGPPSTIVHGPLSVALALDAIVAQLGATALRSLEARLRAPVFPGEELRLTPTDTGAEVTKADGTVALTLSFERS